MTQSLSLPLLLDGRPVHVVGGGSLGGPLAEGLFRAQVPELHLWDFDIVEDRNRFNQRVYECDVGKPKVLVRERILRAIYPQSATKLVLHEECVLPGVEFSGIVLSAVDWNRIRYKEVWPNVKDNVNVSFFGDGRVGMDGGKAYGLNPNNPYHTLRYEDPLHNHPDPVDAEANAACKSEFPLPWNADAVASEMLWLMIRWLQLEQGCTDPYDNFVGWQYKPRKVVLTEQWDAGTIRVMETREDTAG